MEPEQDTPLPLDVVERLAAYDIHLTGEVKLRRLLESYARTYTLYRLAPAAARKWKARYRIMIGDSYYDCQSAAEAYARALALVLETRSQDERPGSGEQAPAPRNS